jgi:hypothetical protein
MRLRNTSITRHQRTICKPLTVDRCHCTRTFRPQEPTGSATRNPHFIPPASFFFQHPSSGACNGISPMHALCPNSLSFFSHFSSLLSSLTLFVQTLLSSVYFFTTHSPPAHQRRTNRPSIVAPLSSFYLKKVVIYPQHSPLVHTHSPTVP